MNAHFHTPSFGDEVFDLSDIEYNANANFVQHHQQLQSKRMRDSMDSSLNEYHSANDESFVANNNSSALIASPTPTATATAAARKQLTPSSDPNEPAKPLSAYALFFRDTVSAIKQQNPNCSFQEISRIVASMWEALDPSHKNVYNKKNEMAKNEYIKQMRIYRQQQLEQQQLAQNSSPPIHTKPAVFTITRKNSDSDGQTYGNNSTNHQQNNSPPQQQHVQGQYQQSHYQQQFEMQQQQNYTTNHNQQAQQNQVEQQQQQQQQQQQNNSYSTTTTNCVDSQPPPAQQIQLLTEAGSVQKCIRDHCSKRAIINPDWEDEYCSNECVVIHCRNVFNSWVQSNLDARTQ